MYNVKVNDLVRITEEKRVNKYDSSDSVCNIRNEEVLVGKVTKIGDCFIWVRELGKSIFSKPQYFNMYVYGVEKIK